MQVRLSNPADPAKRKLIETCWNKVTFVQDPTQTRNQHETSAAIRRAMETSVFRHVASAIGDDRPVVFVDVGGNPTRTRGSAERAFDARGPGRLNGREFSYYSQTPLISPADHHRQLDVRRRGNCSCTFEECAFRKHHVQPLIAAQPNGQVVYNFTDSIYYIDFQTILHVLIRDKAIAVGCNHEFPSYPTTIAIPHDSVHEGDAIVYADGTVVMEVKGNGTTYSHAAFVLPKSEVQGTYFNADFRLTSLSDRTYHGVLDNTEYSLSFSRIYTCGTYVGWQAIAVPKKAFVHGSPSMTHFKVGIYAAECLALRASTTDAVRTVCVKMLRRNGGDLETLPRIVAQAMAQLEAINRPIVDQLPKTTMSLWGAVHAVRRKLASACRALGADEDADEPPDTGVFVRPQNWFGGGFFGEGDGGEGALARPAPAQAPPGPFPEDQPQPDQPYPAHNPLGHEGVGLGPHQEVDHFLPLQELEHFLRNVPAVARVAAAPGGAALPAGEQMGQGAEAPNGIAGPPANPEPAQVIEQLAVPGGGPGFREPVVQPRAVALPKRRMRALNQEERVKAGQTKVSGEREIAMIPTAATAGPQPAPQPPLPGPGIVPPVAAEPRQPRRKNPEVHVDYKKLWRQKHPPKAPDK